MKSEGRSRPDTAQASRSERGRLFRALSFVRWEIARRRYRRRRLNLGVAERLARLREELSQLPRSGVGPLVKDLDPALDRRLEPLRREGCELIVGDFDMDGGLLPRFGDLSGAPVIGAGEFMPRTDAGVVLVDLDGRLGVRKEFGDRVGRFMQELDALLHLEAYGCPVPRLMNVDWSAHAITESFVPGPVVRELLANAGADIRDRDVNRSFWRSRHAVRVRAGRRIVHDVLSDAQIAAIAAGLQRIHAAGFVLEDVKFGNIILDSRSGEPVFIDLERALPIGSLPKPLAEHLKQVDSRKLRDHFGTVPDAGLTTG